MRMAARDAVGAVALAAVAAVLLWSFFRPDPPDRVNTAVAITALLLAGLYAVAASSGVLPLPSTARAGLVAALAFVALVAWQGLSLTWSLLPDASWNAANRGLACGAFAALGLVVGALVPQGPRRAAELLAAVLGVLVVAALAGKVFAGIEPDYGRIARLRWPIGYWNGLALLAVLALLLGIWLAVERRLPGPLLAYVAMVTTALTLSRGAVAVGVVGVVAWLWLDRRRLETFAALVVAGVPAAAVSGIAFALSGVTNDGQPRGVRAHDGWIFGLAFAGGAAVVAGAAYLLARRQAPPRAERLAGRVTVAVTVLAAVGLVAATVVGWRDFVNPRDTGQVPTSAARLTRASSNHRWQWWGEAWHTFRDHPLDGTGAASFSLAHRLLRATYTPDVNEPHDLPLQALAETGIVGFALLVAVVGGAVTAIRERLRGDDPGPVAALSVCALAWALQALVDIPYELLSVAAPFFFLLGVLIARPGERRRGGDVFWAVGLGGVAAAAALSVAAPALAEKSLEEGRFAQARSLNPLSIDPVLAEALLAEDRAPGRALQLYHDAINLQPQNPTPWEQLGLFRLSRRDYCGAYQALNQAYTLDRHDYNVFHQGGPLDVARAKVNAGACG